MKARRIGSALPGAWAILFLLACPTTGAGRGGAPMAAAPVSGVSAGKAEEPVKTESPVTASLREALHQSCEELSADIPGNVSLAIISIASGDPAEEEFAAEELTLLLVNTRRHSIVDRRNIDLIRAEQNFQLSGEVDDDTAVSIGHFIGAAIVITGTISSPYNGAKYLRLKALDVETGEIRAMASRRFSL